MIASVVERCLDTATLAVGLSVATGAFGFRIVDGIKGTLAPLAASHEYKQYEYVIDMYLSDKSYCDSWIMEIVTVTHQVSVSSSLLLKLL